MSIYILNSIDHCQVSQARATGSWKMTKTGVGESEAINKRRISILIYFGMSIFNINIFRAWSQMSHKSMSGVCVQACSVWVVFCFVFCMCVRVGSCCRYHSKVCTCTRAAGNLKPRLIDIHQYTKRDCKISGKNVPVTFSWTVAPAADYSGVKSLYLMDGGRRSQWIILEHPPQQRRSILERSMPSSHLRPQRVTLMSPYLLWQRD